MKTKTNYSHIAQLYMVELHQDVKKYAFQLLVALAVLLGIGLWVTFTTRELSFQYHDPGAETLLPLFILGFIFGGFYSASCLCNNLDSKTKRISSFMLPASTLEKYIVRWTIFVPAMVIAYIVGFFIVDLIRYVFAIIIHSNANGIHLTLSDLSFWYEIYPFICLFLIGQSFYALGSAVWPKRGFIATTIFLLAIGIAISVFVSILFTVTHIFDSFSNNYYIFRSIGQWIEYNSTLILGLITLLVCGVNYVLAYFRIKEMDLIDSW